jgi:dsRNA-specific ribonuclease
LLLSLQVENQTLLDHDRGRRTPSYYEDAFEAFIGSILLEFGEKGYLYADRFVRSVIENIIDFAELISKNDNFKDSLQRFYQKMPKGLFSTPVYSSLQEDGPLYRKIFTRILVISNKQLSEMSEIVQMDIKKYNGYILEEYRLKNPTVFSKLFDICQNDNYILGIGFGRKVTGAEQECAKICLENFKYSIRGIRRSKISI